MHDDKTQLLNIFALNCFIPYSIFRRHVLREPVLKQKAYTLSIPVWERLLESDGPYPGIDKNVIVSDESYDTTDPEDERFVHPLGTKYPRLDILTEEHL